MSPVNIPALAKRVHPVVEIRDGQPITTSIEVARVFEKRHDHVLDAIKTLVAQLDEDYRPNFREVITEYQNGKGGTQTAPAYHLTRDGFTLLAFGFTGKRAMAFKLAYIKAFNQMEAALAEQAQQPARNYHNATVEQAYSLAQQTAAIVADKMYRAALTGQAANAERWLFMVSGHGSKVTPVDARAFALTPAQIIEALKAGDIGATLTDIELTQLAQAAMERVKIRLGKPAAPVRHLTAARPSVLPQIQQTQGQS